MSRGESRVSFVLGWGCSKYVLEKAAGSMGPSGKRGAGGELNVGGQNELADVDDPVRFSDNEYSHLRTASDDVDDGEDEDGQRVA